MLVSIYLFLFLSLSLSLSLSLTLCLSVRPSVCCPAKTLPLYFPPIAFHRDRGATLKVMGLTINSKRGTRNFFSVTLYNFQKSGWAIALPAPPPPPPPKVPVPGLSVCFVCVYFNVSSFACLFVSLIFYLSLSLFMNLFVNVYAMKALHPRRNNLSF